MRIAILLLMTAVVLAGCKRQENTFVAPPPPQVGVMHPVSRLFTPSLEATGNTVAYNQVDLVARVEGFVQSIDYTDGAQVKRGQTLFVIEPAPYQAKLQQSQAQLTSSQADSVYQAAQYQRLSILGKSDFQSQASVDQQRARMIEAQSDVQNYTAAVALAGINLGYTNVVAPFDGTVTNHLVSVGALVGVTNPTKLASIVQLAPIYVTFNISEQDVLRVRQEMAKAGFTVADLRKVGFDVGLMTDQGYPHHGMLDYAAPEVDTSTGTLLVRGVIPNTDYTLLPGYFVRVRVPMPHLAAPALLVPDVALGTDQAGRYLLTVDKNNVVHQQPVEVGGSDGTLRVITKGISEGDEVIVTGLSRAVPGEKVNPAPASSSGS